MAFSLPMQDGPKIHEGEASIADIATTMAALYGLTIESTTVGHDLSSWLR